MQPHAPLDPAHVDSLLKAAQLDAQIGQQAYQAWQRYADVQSGALGWHGADDIVTLNGLAGEYSWSEAWLQPGKISFTFDPGKEGSQGTYRSSTLLSSEEGVFYCVPNNPAIGWASISLLKDGTHPRHFIVEGMMTDGKWKIGMIMLNKLGPNGPVNPPFPALRLL
ncbi:MAG TPA: hypothetical protein VFP68_17725 [Burkholderiaceae bacterium]|nr:hypothetical protein [Burkholderiaceae bacterium]